ncbi:MAG: hypothetical protein M1833_001208 [Piccolia ochrophora]|nr:MAG: hypothetical protein M1833_001208 [Piccolia ochrophora]
MLLVQQFGSVKVGDVVRYSITYTPSADRILPAPSSLYVKIKNTSAIALRAAYLHGPYTLHVAAYPSEFKPNQKWDSPERTGLPQYEPQLKAGGTWTAKLTVPEDILDATPVSTAVQGHESEAKSVTWIVELASQILFSQSATVHFEVLVARDEKSLDLSFAKAEETASPGAKTKSNLQSPPGKKGHRSSRSKGVYSGAVRLLVEDTTALWNKPPLPHGDEEYHRPSRDSAVPSIDNKTSLLASDGTSTSNEQGADPKDALKAKERQRKVHLVILTHGLHSNVGADLLYLKESIDMAAKEAKEGARKQRKYAERAPAQDQQTHSHPPATSESMPVERGVPQGAPETMSDDVDVDDNENNDDEDVVVRGFSDNAARTERGIKYLGKRLAKYVLWMTYPEQPFLPMKKSAGKSLSVPLGGPSPKDAASERPAHVHSTIHREANKAKGSAHKITSISFIGHSLGGLVQTYAIAYIQKHSPQFFDEIKPVNFIAMATPFLGLSNENPMYVRFALDFGLVGRTGQDLGLTWRPPTIARSGWSAVVGGIGSSADKLTQNRQDPGAKPLLRILPTGPAHKALSMFRNRTVYSNVVNDGIVPLRTSCLLFLDWSGLGRVEKARREVGLVGTVAEWGWNEIMGLNTTSNHHSLRPNVVVTSGDGVDEDGTNTPTRRGEGATVPQPSESDTAERVIPQIPEDPKPNQFLTHEEGHLPQDDGASHNGKADSAPQAPEGLGNFLSFFKPLMSKSHQQKAYKRGQTINSNSSGASSASPQVLSDTSKPSLGSGNSVADDANNAHAPPRTSILESAGALLNPPLPSTDFLIDPSNRSRTIFHDRVYHPEDIPPVPVKRRGPSRSNSSSGDMDSKHGSSDGSGSFGQEHTRNSDLGSMKLEEKIARAYHHDLSWRKVLVRLEPDAHNNMIVRRMFANAYGWPVIKHLVDTHFAYTAAALTRDEYEPNTERAKAIGRDVGDQGEELKGDTVGRPGRSASELREARDEVGELNRGYGFRPTSPRQDSAQWSDHFFEVTDDEDDDVDSPTNAHRMVSSTDVSPISPSQHVHFRKHSDQNGSPTSKGTSDAEIAQFLKAPRPLGDGGSETSKTEPSTGDPSHKTRSSSGSVTDDATQLGLRKSLDHADDGGVAEQVAKLGFSPDHGESRE